MFLKGLSVKATYIQHCTIFTLLIQLIQLKKTFIGNKLESAMNIPAVCQLLYMEAECLVVTADKGCRRVWMRQNEAQDTQSQKNQNHPLN